MFVAFHVLQYLYPKGEIQAIFLFVNIFAIICCIPALLFVMTYLFIPSKRTLAQVIFSFFFLKKKDFKLIEKKKKMNRQCFLCLGFQP